VADARLDNRSELIAVLGLRPDAQRAMQWSTGDSFSTGVLQPGSLKGNAESAAVALLPRIAEMPGPAEEALISDAEIILAAYQRWGEACPEKLVGDFAFALWESLLRP
jgi:hypothetical protein